MFGGLLIVVLAGFLIAAAVVGNEEVNNSEQSSGSQSNQESSLEVQDGSQLDQTLNQNEGADVLKGSKLDGFEPITEPVNELKIVDLKEGDGVEVPENANITAHYTGAYAVNGEIFESSKDSGQPFTTDLSRLIPGWVQGIPGMKEGGTRRLIIPGELAYGEAPEGYTPGSTGRPMGTLVFDIELISVNE